MDTGSEFALRETLRQLSSEHLVLVSELKSMREYCAALEARVAALESARDREVSCELAV